MESRTHVYTRKQYADTKGTDYQYTAAGRLRTRTWARGIVTTYGYTQGLLTATDYSDATPDVTLTYEPLGRQSTVTQANQSQIAYAYNPANLRLDTETIRYDLDRNGTYEFTRVLDRSRDTLNRDSGFQLLNGPTIENQATYQYQPTTGRLGSVSGGGLQPPSPSNTFTYNYLPNSNLIQTLTGPIHTTTTIYEPHRDILDTKQNKVGSSIISNYDYAVNAIGQRTSVATSGTEFPTLPSWLWGYDSLCQVTRADCSVNTSDRAYQYDSIGNRKKAANSLTLPATDNYTSNNLNQYSNITQGSAGVSPEYDFDGNMTSGPLPTAPTTNNALTWDAENRLISTTVGTTTTTYQYDSQSRRIAKTTSTTILATIYDSWNPVATYKLQNSSFILHNSLLWGTDLSGTLQGAGGVGGLLSESQISNSQISNFFPTYDGNGNVSEYLTSTGTVAAHFEYDPFGTTVVNTDSAGQFNYRFSTKPRDSETGLYYYGYRYYDPVTGRWPSRDPIEERGGVNLYGFLGNSGINLIDVLGLHCRDCSKELKECKKNAREKLDQDEADEKERYDDQFADIGIAKAEKCATCDETYGFGNGPAAALGRVACYRGWDVAFAPIYTTALAYHSGKTVSINALYNLDLEDCNDEHNECASSFSRDDCPCDSNGNRILPRG